MEINIVTAESIHKYLIKNFLGLEQIVRATGKPEQEIAKLIEDRCIPGPSYKFKKNSEVFSHLSGNLENFPNEEESFYAPSLINWIAQAEQEKYQGKVIYAKFEHEYFESLIQRNSREYGFAEFFEKNGNLIETKARAEALSEWENTLKGIYGICIKGPVTADAIVRKAIATNRVTELTDGGKKVELESALRLELIDALKEFDQVVSHFAPHDWPKSSRKRLFDDLVLKYNLASEFPYFRIS